MSYTWSGGDPSKKEAILDPKGAISVYQGRKIPTGRKKRRGKYYSGYGDLDPTNSRLIALLKGELEPAMLDDDELSYGITKCDDGKFSIKAAYEAATLPTRLRNALKRELLKRAENHMEGHLLGAIARIGDIATSPMSDDKDAMKAAQYIVERVQGKTPDILVHTQEKKFEVVIENISRGSRNASREARGMLEQDPPMEAEIIEEG